MTTPPVSKPSSLIYALGAGLAHSLLLFLAFPPIGWWPCALIAMLPLIWLAVTRPGLRLRDYLALLAGVVTYWGYTEWWTLAVAGAGWGGLSLIESAWPLVFVWLLGRTSRRWPRLGFVVSVPLLWTGIEFCRGELFADGYAWSLIAYPLIESPLLNATAPAIGVYGVGLLTALLAGVMADGALARRRVWSFAGLGVWFVATMLGVVQRPLADGEALRAAVVQTNVPQSNKVGWTVEQQLKDFERFERFTREAAAAGPELIVWPETMLPGMTLETEALDELARRGLVLRIPSGGSIAAGFFAESAKELTRELKIPMLLGAVAMEGLKITDVDGGFDITPARRYNSVYMLANGRVSGTRYDKVCLTPFGETMPYISAWPWLEQKMMDVGARGMKFDLDKGTGYDVFEIPTGPGHTVRAVTPICFEVTVGPHCRRLVYGPHGRRVADVIVNVTNDGWFGTFDTAREQHMQIARWRCLELGTPMVRAANTGVSSMIDARGRVLRRGVDGGGGSAGARVDGVLSGTVTLQTGDTIYGRFGDVAAWTAVFASLVLGFSTFVGGGRRYKEEQTR